MQMPLVDIAGIFVINCPHNMQLNNTYLLT